MDERLSHFYGSDNFEALDYRLVREGVLTGIEVSARRKSWGPNFLRFGLELQDDFEGGNSFNAGVRAQVTEVNRYGAEWQTDLQVGANPRFQTEFYQPIGYTSNWFVVPRLLVERQNFDIFEGDRRLATYRVRNREAEFDFGREFGSWGELRAGIIRGEGNRYLLVGDPDDPDLPPRTRFDRGEFLARFSVDLLDDVYFPRDGELFTLQWNGPRESLGAEANADRVLLRLDARALARPRTRWSSRPRAAPTCRGRRTRCRISIRWADSSTSRACRRTRSAVRISASRGRSTTGASAAGRTACSTCRLTSASRSSSATSGSGAAT